MQKINSKNKGFTLVEVMVAVGLFALVLSMSLGAITQVFSVNKKAQMMSVIMGDLSSSLEVMTTQMRYGSGHTCEEKDSGSCVRIKFTNYNEEEMEYFLKDELIWVSIDGEEHEITSLDVAVKNLQFNILDSLIVIALKGEVGYGVEKSEFNLQTSVSRRGIGYSI